MFYQKVTSDREIVFERKTSTYSEHELHFHDILELHVLKKNEAHFQLADRRYDGKPGDVFLFRPFEPHWNLTKDPEKPIEWVSILFSPSIVRFIPDGFKLLAPFYAVRAVSPLIPAESPEAAAIQELASLALEEEAAGRIGWEAKQFVYFADILIHILRHAERSSGKTFGVQPDFGVVHAIEYMLEHYFEVIDIDKLVALAGKQRTYFYKRFKKATGITPNQFIHKLRIQAAAHLLRHTELPVTEIAYECGYQNVEFFAKHFRQSQGQSPREYRKSQ